jgi:hypothetical protein
VFLQYYAAIQDKMHFEAEIRKRFSHFLVEMSQEFELSDTRKISKMKNIHDFQDGKALGKEITSKFIDRKQY